MPGKQKKNSEEMMLEDIFKALDQTIETLESQNITLEDSFTAYQKGMELLKKCNEKIDLVEKKMLILNEDGKTNEF